MNDHQILYIKSREDQETVALALYRAGYSVRKCKLRSSNGKTTETYLEYWRESGC